jgi:hypothetical protein
VVSACPLYGMSPNLLIPGEHVTWWKGFLLGAMKKSDKQPWKPLRTSLLWLEYDVGIIAKLACSEPHAISWHYDTIKKVVLVVNSATYKLGSEAIGCYCPNMYDVSYYIFYYSRQSQIYTPFMISARSVFLLICL